MIYLVLEVLAHDQQVEADLFFTVLQYSALNLLLGQLDPLLLAQMPASLALIVVPNQDWP